KAELPQQDPDQVRAPQAQRQPEPKVQASKEEAGSSLGGGGTRTAVAPPQRPAPRAVAPRKSDKVYGRNDRVSVRYADGKVLKDVKYKSVEQDIIADKCVVIED